MAFSVISWFIFLLIFVSSTFGYGIHRRNDETTLIEEFYKSKSALKFHISQFAARPLLWNENTRGTDVVRAKHPREKVQPKTTLIGVVAGRTGVWMFDMTQTYQWSISPNVGNDAAIVKGSGVFKQRFGYTILGDTSYASGSDSADKDGQVGTTLITFLEKLADQGDVPACAFIIAMKATNNDRPQNYGLIRAITSRLEDEINIWRAERELPELEVQWMPVSPTNAGNIREAGFAVRRTYKDTLPGLPGQVDGHEIEVYFGTEECLRAQFSNVATGKDNSVVRYNKQMTYLGPVDEATPQRNIAAELIRLWESPDFFEFIGEAEIRDKLPAATLVDLWTTGSSITKHDNKVYAAVEMTVVTTYGCWTILLPRNVLYNPKWKEHSSPETLRQVSAFRKFVSKTLESEHKKSIYSNWQEDLRLFKSDYCREFPAKLLDIIIVYAAGEDKEIRGEVVFKALVLEMLRIAEEESGASGDDSDTEMVDAEEESGARGDDSDTEMTNGNDKKVKHAVALDTTDWSRTVRYLPARAVLQKDLHMLHYFLVHEQFQENLLSFNEPGYILKLFYGPFFRATWSIGLSGEVEVRYEDLKKSMLTFTV